MRGLISLDSSIVGKEDNKPFQYRVLLSFQVLFSLHQGTIWGKGLLWGSRLSGTLR